MDISTIANLINAIAVTAGVIFAAAQIRQYRQRRQRDAMLELVRSFQSPAFTAALRRVLSLPDGADSAKIREVLGPDGEDAVYLVSLTWESLGVLVYRREVTLDLVTCDLVAETESLFRRMATHPEPGDWERMVSLARGKNAGARKNIAPDSCLRCAPPLALTPRRVWVCRDVETELIFGCRMCDT